MLLNKFVSGRQRLLFTACIQRRTITKFSVFSETDPYYILGASKDDDLATIKKKYFDLAKKYHPDLNPDDAKAEAQFLRIQQAFKDVQLEKDPKAREKFRREFAQYEKTSKGAGDGNFKSRRPNTGASGDADDEFGNKDYFQQRK